MHTGNHNKHHQSSVVLFADNTGGQSRTTSTPSASIEHTSLPRTLSRKQSGTDARRSRQTWGVHLKLTNPLAVVVIYLHERLKENEKGRESLFRHRPKRSRISRYGSAFFLSSTRFERERRWRWWTIGYGSGGRGGGGATMASTVRVVRTLQAIQAHHHHHSSSFRLATVTIKLSFFLPTSHRS